MPPVRRLTAILAADVAGYSRLMGADEEGTHERLKAHLGKMVNPKIREHRARARSRCFSALCGFAYSAACGRTSIRHTRPVCLDRPLAATRVMALPFRRSAADANGVLHQNVTLSPVRLRQSKPSTLSWFLSPRAREA